MLVIKIISDPDPITPRMMLSEKKSRLDIFMRVYTNSVPYIK